MMEMGTPEYGTKFVKREWRSVISGKDNVYRILPPFGSLAKTGKWYKFSAVHFGYQSTDGKNKPFPCVLQKDKNKMTITPCAACERVEAINLKYQNVEKELVAQGKTKEEITRTLEPLAALKSKFNLDKKFLLNAIDLAGTVVILKLGYRHLRALEEEIKKAKEKYNRDPVSVQGGLFFNFTKSGMGGLALHKVELFRESRSFRGEDGTLVSTESLKDGALTPDQIAKFTSDYSPMADLSALYTNITAEQVSYIVSVGPTAVDAVFGKSEYSGGNGNGKAAETQAAPATTAPAQVTPAVQPTPVGGFTPPTRPADPLATVFAGTPAQVVNTPPAANPVATPIATAPAQPAPSFSTAEISNMSEEELLKLFQGGN